MRGYDSDATVNESLDALRHPKRRRLLFDLLEQAEGTESAAQCELASVFEYEDEESYIELVHIHLPKLADAGFVNWERGNRSVEPGPRWGDIKPVLSLIYNHLDELPPKHRGTQATRGDNGA